MLVLFSAILVAGAVSAGEPPVIPVGLDAYLMWDRWPYQRIGARAYMRSTYDRTGGNETADASHFLYQVAEDFNVTLDVEGSGVLYFVRTNHWHGSPWHYEVDGVAHIVTETTTADPTRKMTVAEERSSKLVSAEAARKPTMLASVTPTPAGTAESRPSMAGRI